ncbi:microsomal signal peptidase 25 kDa subunit-domain-containing protein [Auriculariales sp. MPI-PUGE-AT-0066]|nr:microsomal signal peptidase 25 kDa subunit-domain-containing protein [Auriculariales sp. MPI-PUGE-AT-0066]
MAPRKQASSSAVPASSSRAVSPSASVSGKPTPIPLILTLEGNAARELVRVNNASATELKIACDDAVKRFLSQPSAYKMNNLHTDVRLALGWGSVIVSGLTGLYGYKNDFEKAKPVVWAGVILYVILSSLQTLYAYFIEQNIIFEGKRKTLQGRIETETVTLSSKTQPAQSKTSSPGYELQGTMDQDAFDTWVHALVSRAMGSQPEPASEPKTS